MGGSGRQSLTRLATHIQENEIYQIEVAKGYGLPEFREDLRACLMKAGVENKIEIFLFTDTQIINEQFVEAVNNVNVMNSVFEGNYGPAIVVDAGMQVRIEGNVMESNRGCTTAPLASDSLSCAPHTDWRCVAGLR